jgi:hypothetical protein
VDVGFEQDLVPLVGEVLDLLDGHERAVGRVPRLDDAAEVAFPQDGERRVNDLHGYEVESLFAREDGEFFYFFDVLTKNDSNLPEAKILIRNETIKDLNARH